MMGMSGELVALVAVMAVGGWVLTTWLRIKNGYPLENSWGKALHPKHDPAALERVKLLTQETAELRAEMGAMKDRLVTVERIVTDSGFQLTQDIDRLRDVAREVAREPLARETPTMSGWAIVVIVAIVVGGAVRLINGRNDRDMGVVRDEDGNPVCSSYDDSNMQREIETLRERIKVLERIATDDNSLDAVERRRIAQEIDDLRGKE